MTVRELLARLQSLPPSSLDDRVLLFYRGGADDARDVRLEHRAVVIDTAAVGPRAVPVVGRADATGNKRPRPEKGAGAEGRA